MKKQWKGFLLGIFATVLVIGLIGTAMATYQEMRTITYDDIKIVLNGITLTPTDANGKTVDPFLMQGTTYLPVRAIAEAIGYNVTWDSTTKTVTLTARSENKDVFVLGPGTYVVGEDIDEGKYDCTAISGFGMLTGEVAEYGYFYTTLGENIVTVDGEEVGIRGNKFYSNLRLSNGDIIYVEGTLNVEFKRK